MVPIQLTGTVLAEVARDKLLSLMFKRDNIAATTGVDLASKEHANAACRPILEVSTLRQYFGLIEQLHVHLIRMRLLAGSTITLLLSQAELLFVPFKLGRQFGDLLFLLQNFLLEYFGVRRFRSIFHRVRFHLCTCYAC